MHPEAYQGFGWALAEVGINPTAHWRILDVGGQNVNGSVHDYFPYSTIKTLDLENADIIADATTWEPTELFDIVIATEVFEHVQDWRAVIKTMASALDPIGVGIFIATCASTNRPAHGATGAPMPAAGEWYKNVGPDELWPELEKHFKLCNVSYKYPPGDAYMWAVK